MYGVLHEGSDVGVRSGRVGWGWLWRASFTSVGGRLVQSDHRHRSSRYRRPLPVSARGETIAVDQLQACWRYSFIGELYQQGGRRYFYIVLQNPGRGQLGAEGSESLVPQGMSGPFACGIEEGCAPRKWVLVYGVLAGSRNTVSATIAHTVHRFNRMPIPASISPGGALAYAVLPAVPAVLTVRSVNGRVLASDPPGGEATGPCQPGSIVIAVAK